MSIETIFGGAHYDEYHEVRELYETVLDGGPLPRGFSELELRLSDCKTDDAKLETFMREADGGNRLSSRFPSTLKMDISEEEKQKALHYTGGKEIHIGGIGYVDPSRILSYYCGKCDIEYEGAPKIEIFVDVLNESELTDNHIGQVHGSCKTCNEAIIYPCPLYKGQSPDPKYIVADWSGIFVRPTPESIEELLGEIKQTAKDNGAFDHKKSRVVKTWAGVINYSVDKKLEDLKEFAEKMELEIYVQKLPERVDKIYNKLIASGGIHYPRDPDNMSFVTEEFFEDLYDLLAKLPKINLPEDIAIKEKIHSIVNHYKEDILEADLKEANTNIKELNKRKQELMAQIKKLPKIR